MENELTKRRIELTHNYTEYTENEISCSLSGKGASIVGEKKVRFKPNGIINVTDDGGIFGEKLSVNIDITELIPLINITFTKNLKSAGYDVCVGFNQFSLGFTLLRSEMQQLFDFKDTGYGLLEWESITCIIGRQNAFDAFPLIEQNIVYFFLPSNSIEPAFAIDKNNISALLEEKEKVNGADAYILNIIGLFDTTNPVNSFEQCSQIKPVQFGEIRLFFTTPVAREKFKIKLEQSPDKEEVEELKSLALNFDAKALYSLSARYFRGEGVKEDKAAAIVMLESAASKGSLDSMAQLAVCYVEGYFPLKQDFAKAIYWYEKAAMSDHPIATFNLALMYWEGEGVDKNQPKAIELMNKAASLGMEGDVEEFFEREYFRMENRRSLNSLLEEHPELLSLQRLLNNSLVD